MSEIIEDNENTTKPSKTDSRTQIIVNLQKLNQNIVSNKILFIVSIPLSLVAFITAYYVPFESSWIHWMQTLLFVFSAMCLVLPLSWLFNLLWLALLRKQENKKK